MSGGVQHLLRRELFHGLVDNFQLLLDRTHLLVEVALALFHASAPVLSKKIIGGRKPQYLGYI